MIRTAHGKSSLGRTKMGLTRRTFLGLMFSAVAHTAKTEALALWKKPSKAIEMLSEDEGPELQAPNAPLNLPVWTYGAGSFATDTVLMFRGNPSHTFYGTGPIPDRPRVYWTYRMADYHTTLRGRPVVWSGTGWTGQPSKLGKWLFVGSVDRHLYAFEASTGVLAWKLRAGRMFKSSVCVFENRIYVGNVDNYLRCVDAATGRVLWKLDTGADLDSSPCVVEGRLYIAGESGFARSVDPRTGRELWKTFLGGIGTGTLKGSNGSETSPAVDAGQYFAATYDGFLHCLDLKTGSPLWKAKTGDDTDASPVIEGDFVYVAAEDKAPYLYCFDRDSGREVWRYSGCRKGYWSTPAVVGGRVYIGGNDGFLHCLDARTGKLVWATKCGPAIWSSPCVVDDRVVFGSCDGWLYMLEAKSGREVFRYNMGGRCISTPCIVDGYIWIGTATGHFFCFGP
jgi:outer membrane protein assembly factor BamB